MRSCCAIRHNPIGKVLTLAEEQRLCELAERYDVRIFNDEIHAPFVFEGKHIPFPTISEQAALQSMTATSASKSLIFRVRSARRCC